MRLVTEVRRFRSDQGLRPAQRVAARLAGIEASPLAGHEERIRFLLRLTPPAEAFAPSASLEAEGVTVELDTAGAIDVEAERRRMEKDLAAARKEAGQARAKLANAGFTGKAPAAVVDKTRRRLAVAEQDIARISDRLAGLTRP
jgi:valyl-tRNA synthetase